MTDPDNFQRLIHFLRHEEPRFFELVSSDHRITLSSRGDKGRTVTFLLGERDLGYAISYLGNEGVALWPHLSVERRAFNLLAVHMHELVDIPDTDVDYDSDRVYMLSDARFIKIS